MIGVGTGPRPRRGGAVWTPDALFETRGGDWFDFREPTGLWIDHTASTDPVMNPDDLVGAAVGRRGVMTVIQATTGSKPIWKDNSLQADAFSQKSLTAAFSPTFAGALGSAVYAAGYRVAGTNTFYPHRVALQFTGSSVLIADIGVDRSLHSINASTITAVGTSIGSTPGFAATMAFPTGGGVGQYRSTHVVRTNHPSSARPSADVALLTFNRSTSTYGASLGSVLINGPLTDEELDLLNEYFGIAA